MSGTYEQAQRFLAVSPRPKLRRHAQAKPGAKVLPAVVHVTEDPARGVALVRGKAVGRVIDLAGLAESARWSPAAKGYVVTMLELADVLAAAQHLGAPYRTKQVAP